MGDQESPVTAAQTISPAKRKELRDQNMISGAQSILSNTHTISNIDALDQASLGGEESRIGSPSKSSKLQGKVSKLRNLLELKQKTAKTSVIEAESAAYKQEQAAKLAELEEEMKQKMMLEVQAKAKGRIRRRDSSATSLVRIPDYD